MLHNRVGIVPDAETDLFHNCEVSARLDVLLWRCTRPCTCDATPHGGSPSEPNPDHVKRQVRIAAFHTVIKKSEAMSETDSHAATVAAHLASRTELRTRAARRGTSPSSDRGPDMSTKLARRRRRRRWEPFTCWSQRSKAQLWRPSSRPSVCIEWECRVCVERMVALSTVRRVSVSASEKVTSSLRQCLQWTSLFRSRRRTDRRLRLNQQVDIITVSADRHNVFPCASFQVPQSPFIGRDLAEEPIASPSEQSEVWLRPLVKEFGGKCLFDTVVSVNTGSWSKMGIGSP